MVTSPLIAVDRTADALFGSTRRNVLALLFGRPGEEFYVREIVRTAGTGTGAVQRELGNLLEAGLVRRRTSGRQVYFSANPDSPVFPELRGLLAKTAGITTVVRAGLADLAAKGLIQAAFLFGSVAAGQQVPGSDVDLVVVGSVRLSELLPALGPVQDRLGREINPVLFTPREFAARLAGPEGFLQRVMTGPKLMVVGESGDFARLASQRLDQAPPDQPARSRQSARRGRSKPSRRRRR